MALSNPERLILELIKSNNGAKMEEIIDYLDYINKIKYSEREVSEFMRELISASIVFKKDELWYANK
jgi:transposase